MKTASHGLDAPLEDEITIGENTYREVWQQTEDTKNSQKSVQLFAAN